MQHQRKHPTPLSNMPLLVDDTSIGETSLSRLSRVIKQYHFMWCHLMWCINSLRLLACTIFNHSEPSDSCSFVTKPHIGGGARKLISGMTLRPYVLDENADDIIHRSFSYVGYFDSGECQARKDNDPASYVICNIPLSVVCPLLTGPDLIFIAGQHNITITARTNFKTRCDTLSHHKCYSDCQEGSHLFEWSRIPCMSVEMTPRVVDDSTLFTHEAFPPAPLSEKERDTIINDYCKAMSPTSFEEAGCAVCGQLIPVYKMKLLIESEVSLDIISDIKGVTRKERFSFTDAFEDIPGPILATNCHHLCQSCEKSLDKKLMPRKALANHLWIGDIPNALQDLTYAEKMLIARVRHNRCVMRVASGRMKMTANVVMFTTPLLKVYRMLPPPIKDIEEVLAFVFSGPCAPTEDDFKRTPMLVRRDNVRKALEWLILNHRDYYDLHISDDNLTALPECGIPVFVDYQRMPIEEATTKLHSTESKHDDDEEPGNSTGPCPFAVHGLTGEEYNAMTIDALKAKALHHLASGGATLGIGHAEQPESMYDNPHAYPQMFPWLFCYGLGSIGNPKHKFTFGELSHKAYLLMYYDKRFQTDTFFPIIAFNHDQLKSGVTGSLLLAKKHLFHAFSRRLAAMDIDVLNRIAERSANGERLQCESDEEKICFELLGEIDHVGAHVKGSLTNKKYMRNEIWSLISFQGAPNWFVTLTPADNSHPLSIYYAGNDTTYTPEIKSADVRNLLVSKNPVAAARFFHYMVSMFITHILGVNSEHRGVYGKTAGYYGTVEQQGRLTLHIHMLIWIASSLSPSEIREKIVSKDKEFQDSLVAYLEDCQQGELHNGSLEVIKNVISRKSKEPGYEPPTHTLPVNRQDCCITGCGTCRQCTANKSWESTYYETVDDILVRSNVHSCRSNRVSTSEKGPVIYRKGCLNKHGVCTARFPREYVKETHVDENDGYIKLKKWEILLNTFTFLLSFLSRCNTDVSTLLSGTAMKSAVMYISDYITKQTIKTYQIFAIIRDIFKKHTDEPEPGEQKNRSRRLVLQVVNALSSKLEIGSPMASLYVLGHPDHYTSHQFQPFWWKIYVAHVGRYFELGEGQNNDKNDKVMIGKTEEGYVGSNIVDDYIYRPYECEAMTLYHWIQCSTKKKRSEEERIYFAAHHMTTNGSLFCGKSPETQSLCYQADHPLFLTHGVCCDVRKARYVVPNFVGGPLPRRDSGDREYYCRTMLVMFKAWRRPQDLKNWDASWNETFSEFKFSERQLKIMENYHIKYECNDARDDYFAMLKRANAVADDGHFDRAPMDIDGNDEINDVLMYGEEENDADTTYTMLTLSKSEIQKLNAIKSTQDMLRRIGWMDPIVPTVPLIPVPFFKPSIAMSAVAWTQVLKDRKEKATQLRLCSLPKAINGSVNGSTSSFYINNVSILPSQYFDNHKGPIPFDMEKIKFQHDMVLKIVGDYSLNKEQRRAFMEIANCIEGKFRGNVHQLLMYVGGVGGTGKSQVIKAIKALFHEREEDYRFIVVAPTGSAAALLGGVTYHSLLGIWGNGDDNSYSMRNEEAGINSVREKIIGLEFVFLDEVSMVSCIDMYNISAQLAKAKNKHDEPFGGMNMIMAGDFAQLPPTTGPPLYGCNDIDLTESMSYPQQINVMGKLLWHQFTNIVILRENMRQTDNSEADVAFRTALKNMRYAACTPTDINFLQSRIIKSDSFDNKQFGDSSKSEIENTAIITARNLQKDVINDVGSVRFAAEHDTTLFYFVSIDKIRGQDDSVQMKKGSHYPITSLSHSMQQELWDLLPSSTDQFAGTLKLCIGMPVMIRLNYATDLCITKGQEGVVRGWDSSLLNGKHLVLDTLYVELINPPSVVNIRNLPLNVVPLVKKTRSIRCVLSSGRKLTVSRSQVEILLNFSMTDYGAQGKDRKINPVNLQDCKNQQSYYTALSRGTSAKGTIIIQGFDTHKITKGISGYLRQEFRELDMLDQISKERYLSNSVQKIITTRNDLFALSISSEMKGREHKYGIIDRWRIINKPSKTNDKTVSKNVACIPNVAVAKAFKWDSVDFSCAYDAFFTILLNLWSEDPDKWSTKMKRMTDHMKKLVEGFERLRSGTSPENVRDAVRANLQNVQPNTFPPGHTGTCFSDLATVMTEDSLESVTSRECTSCNVVIRVNSRPLHTCQSIYPKHVNDSYDLNEYIKLLCDHEINRVCVCGTPLREVTTVIKIPDILIMDVYNNCVKYNDELRLKDNSGDVTMRLCGIVYLGDFHFTCRYVDREGAVWFNDGRINGNDLVAEQLTDSRHLLNAGTRSAVGAVYAKI